MMPVMVGVTWRSTQGNLTFARDLAEGDVIAVDYTPMRHKPWRIESVKQRDERIALIVRPLGAQYDFAQYNQGISVRSTALVDVLPEHYVVCAKCGQLPPCAEVWNEHVARQVTERAARYEVAGVCPACEEPVTNRQRMIRVEENIVVPLGPPVTFHARQKCESAAVRYDQQVAEATGRAPVLSCPSRQVRHMDGQRECDNEACPGQHVPHHGFAMCHYLNADGCARPECQEQPA